MNKKGDSIYDTFDYGNWSSAGTYWLPDPEVKETLTKKCSCGTNVAMRYEAPEEFHSSYCDLKEKV